VGPAGVSRVGRPRELAVHRVPGDGRAADARLYTAAAATVIGEYLYFTEFGKEKARVALYRTRDPEKPETWEKVTGDLPPYADPCLFVDPPTGKLFMYNGLDKPIFCVELDPKKNFAEAPGTKKQLMDEFNPKEKVRDGWEVCTWDNSEASKPGRSTKTFFPCREGSWMTFHAGRYYLQYASPGTTVPGYGDGLLLSDSPLGPFVYSQYSPISRKASGFIGSAGHSCLFQDKFGNWWRATTMLIGVNERMERRIGLFPAGFDKDGVPYTRTELGDLPITLATGPRDQLKDDVYAGWWRLPVKPSAASSSVDGHSASRRPTRTSARGGPPRRAARTANGSRSTWAVSRRSAPCRSISRSRTSPKL
jgi:hypothetical protein